MRDARTMADCPSKLRDHDSSGVPIRHLCGLLKNHEGPHKCWGEDCDKTWEDGGE